jgi:hypothetical protein
VSDETPSEMRRFAGWKGLLVEADQGAYQELKGRSGRGASLLHHVPQGKGGRCVVGRMRINQSTIHHLDLLRT